MPGVVSWLGQRLLHAHTHTHKIQDAMNILLDYIFKKTSSLLNRTRLTQINIYIQSTLYMPGRQARGRSYSLAKYFKERPAWLLSDYLHVIYGVSVERKERKGEKSGEGDRDMQQTDIKHLSIDSDLERLLCLCCLSFHTQRTGITKVPSSNDCSEG